MNLSDMRSQPDAKMNNLSKANFFDWKDAGTMGSKVRPFGQWVRRYLHFIRVYKKNGEEIWEDGDEISVNVAGTFAADKFITLTNKSKNPVISSKPNK